MNVLMWSPYVIASVSQKCKIKKGPKNCFICFELYSLHQETRVPGGPVSLHWDVYMWSLNKDMAGDKNPLVQIYL